MNLRILFPFFVLLSTLNPQLSTSLLAATVTGSVLDITLQPLDTKFLFTPTNDVLVTAGGLSAGPPTITNSTGGQFTIVLDAGDYTVSLPLINTRRPFMISVPVTNGAINITNLMNPPRTYTWTNNLSANLFASSSISVDGPQLYYDWSTLSNGVVAVSAWNTGNGMIRPPGIYFFNTNGAEMGSFESWADHGGLASRPETLFKSIRNIAIMPGGDGQGDAGVQMGMSNPNHETFYLQYDSDMTSSSYNDGIAAWPIGHSKKLGFHVHAGIPGGSYLEGMPGIMGFAGGTNNYLPSQTANIFGLLRFYTVLPQFSGNTLAHAGVWVAQTRTNGFEHRGILVQERRTATLSSTNVPLDFSQAQCVDLTSGVTNLSFSTTNATGLATNYERRVFLLRAGGTSPSITYPITWNTNISAARPTNLISGQLLRLELETTGPGETNINLVSAQALSDNSFAWDPDASSFFTRAGITDPTQKAALNTLVLNAKANGWWTLCDAIYPFVGGTASSHRENLKSSSFQITWSGTVTHNANGITGDGSSGYGDTTYVNSTSGQLNSCHLFLYCRTQNPVASRLAGVTSGASFFALEHQSGGLDIDGLNSGTLHDPAVAADLRGCNLATRTSSTVQTLYYNDGANNAAGSSTSTSQANQSMYVLARNASGAASFTDANLAGMSIGSGISSGIAAAMFADWRTFQTALNRKVP